MDKGLEILGVIKAKSGSEEIVKAELLNLIEPTKHEKGCLQCDILQNNKNSNIFLSFENWENRQLWQDHMHNDHLAEYLKATESLVENSTFHVTKF